ncbi:MAG: LytS/YhcK type 5TM receptor domain-containing protein [Desulfovibrio sp.]
METLDIIIVLAERFGLLLGCVFLLLIFMPFKRMEFMRMQASHRTALLVVFFGVFGIIGTYTGNSVFQSVANLRAMAVITGGLFGGPVVGLGAGLIAGAHRILVDLNGFSAYPCGFATIIEGVAAGYIASRYGAKAMSWKIAAPLAILGESIHMILVLTLSRPYDEAVALVKLIAPPMIFVNTFGVILFVEMMNMFFLSREKRESIHAHNILDIANLTVGHLRSGLNRDTAEATARIIFDRVDAAAVALTDRKQVLAHVGAGNDHHLAGGELRTKATKQVLETGRPVFLDSTDAIGCNNPDCPNRSAIVVPLLKNHEIVGTLKFYGSTDKALSLPLFELAKGLGNLFSTQLELENIQLNEQLLANAEIRRLQAQINPHFLFNSLNTMASFCRTSPDKARELLLDLALYMRRNLDSGQAFIPLSDELEQVRSYLAIETARFGDRIRVDIDVPFECEKWPIPPLIIQPLVENAVRHGILGKEEGGTIALTTRIEGDDLHVTVLDDGIGMDPALLDEVCCPNRKADRGGSIGLRNCAFRLERIYGKDCKLRINGQAGKGTEVQFTIPAEAMEMG